MSDDGNNSLYGEPYEVEYPGQVHHDMQHPWAGTPKPTGAAASWKPKKKAANKRKAK